MYVLKISCLQILKESTSILSDNFSLSLFKTFFTLLRADESVLTLSMKSFKETEENRVCFLKL